MKNLLLIAAGAAVALSAVPADARYRHHGRDCAMWRHGHCVRWMNHGYMVSMARHARYRTGYVFGPSYAYTDYGALPPAYVRQYDLTPRYRYVYRDNYIYVVDPATYAITRILNAMPR